MLGSAIVLILLLGPVKKGAAFASFAHLHSGATINGLSILFPQVRSSSPKKNYSPSSSLSSSSSSSSSSLNYYGPRGQNSESDEDTNEIITSSSSSSSTSHVTTNNRLNDEQTIHFYTSNNILNDNYSEDPLCDFEDVDCQAFLPQTTSTYLTVPSDTYLATQLKTRSESIERVRIEHNWKVAHCPTTFVSVSKTDYIRRVHMETYPIAVCGGARGGVYVINIETKNVIGKAEGMHICQVENEQPGSGCSTSSSSSSSSRRHSRSRRYITHNHTKMAKEAMEKLYGKLDGGGVVSVAIHGDFIASSGREGGVRLCKIKHSVQYDISNLAESSNAINNNLVPLGTIPGLDNTIVTCLKFDSYDRLWTASFDGRIRAYNMVSPSPMPLFQSDFTDSVLDMHLCEELQLGVCATADGGVALFHMNDGQFFAGIILSEVSTRSVLIMKHRNRMEYSVLCGTSDGIIHSLPLKINSKTGTVDEENPFRVSETTDTTIKPRHVGPVMCIISPCDGIFVSGGQDGALRVWDCTYERYSGSNDVISEDESIETILQTKCMYALTGYKLWLASACTDGKRLVSDGGENSIVVRDFSSEPRTNGKASL